MPTASLVRNGVGREYQMGFRRDSLTGREFSRWRSESADLLRHSGVPPGIYSHRRIRWYFIEHGHSPEFDYATTLDQRLQDAARQASLARAILACPGASESQVFSTLPPNRFPQLWQRQGMGYVLKRGAEQS